MIHLYPVHGARDEQILQPIFCIAFAVETLSWTGFPLLLAYCTWRRGAAVPEQRQRAYPTLSGLACPMNLVRVKTGTIEDPQQPIDHMTGTMRIAVVIELTELRTLGAELQRRRFHGRIRYHPLGPFPPATQALGKRAFTGGVIRLPHTVLELRKDLA